MLAILLLMLLQIQVDVEARSIPNYSNPLNIHMRLQWPNAGGYCGETSAQVTALLNGAWVSQGAWCAAGGGPSSSAGQLLLSANLEDALTVMGLTWKRWDKTLRAQSLASDGQPEYSAFTAWMKAYLAVGSPVIFGEYLTDGTNDPDYDHIIPAVGFSSTGYLTYYNLYQPTAMVLPFARLNATRRSCKRSLTQGGCIPSKVDYGAAVTGIIDANHVTLPVRLAVNRPDEPNYSKVDPTDPDEYRTSPEKPALMHGTVTVTGLTPGNKYRLMRFNATLHVPTKGTAASFLASSYESFVDFTAPSKRNGVSKWVYVDPRPFLSSGTVFYRCVPK